MAMDSRQIELKRAKSAGRLAGFRAIKRAVEFPESINAEEFIELALEEGFKYLNPIKEDHPLYDELMGKFGDGAFEAKGEVLAFIMRSMKGETK